MTPRATTTALILGCSIIAGAAAASEGKLSCAGSLIEPTALAQSPITVNLSFPSARRMVLNLGHGDVESKVTSDNKLQLKFLTKDFVGELFHYTNDLFLIYHSGHLAKLTCKPE